MSDEQKKVTKKLKKKRSSKNFVYVSKMEMMSDDIQKWINLSNFWKTLALGAYVRATAYICLHKAKKLM